MFQGVIDFLAQWFCTCGARRRPCSLPQLPLSPPPTNLDVDPWDTDASLPSPASQHNSTLPMTGGMTESTGHHVPYAKPPPPIPPPTVPTHATSSAASSSTTQPQACPPNVKPPPPCVFHFHSSQIERNLGLHWANFAFLTYDQYIAGWTTHYTDDYSRVFFHNPSTQESRWTPPEDPPDTDHERDTEDSTGGS